jgi:hypothetical protein
VAEGGGGRWISLITDETTLQSWLLTAQPIGLPSHSHQEKLLGFIMKKCWRSLITGLLEASNQIIGCTHELAPAAPWPTQLRAFAMETLGDWQPQ